MPVELLLVDSHSQRTIIERKIEDLALPEAPEPKRPIAPLEQTDDWGHTPDIQRWTVLHADTRDGHFARASIEPLIEFRREHCHVRTLAVPDLENDQASIDYWLRNQQIGTTGGHDDADAEYVLILGDLPDVSLEVQYEVAERAYVGRLCFTDENGDPDPDGYRSYCDKLIEAETQDTIPSARSMFYCSRGDPVSEQAYGSVVRRSWKSADDDDFAHRFTRWAELASFENSFSEPAVLFSMCHGAFEPDPYHQAERQGGLVLQETMGGAMEFLFGENFYDQRFLSQGFWFMMTCYSAATPATSVYAPWLAQLRATIPASYIEKAHSSLAAEQPFIARIPQVVLANPEGPLGVLGHADMTWSMGYNDHRMNDQTGAVRTVVGAAYSAYAAVVNSVAGGNHFGPAARRLLEFSEESIKKELGQSGSGGDTNTLRALRYMRYLDRRCYVLLGDPAARLPVD